MSAITGIYNFDAQSVDRIDLQQMVDVLQHRGTDGAEIWSNHCIGLGHRMLWTTPESLTEKLPLSKNGLVITADARIDNRDELKKVLNLPDRPLEQIADSEFILAAYERWGEDCPQHLLGDFAFAIWNSQTQTLFCARDHFGIKPFYYYLSSRSFVFATEIKAIFCAPDIPHQINPVRIGDHLTSMFHDPAITAYQNIFRLPPAHSITISLTGTKLEPYWNLDPTHELRFSSDEDYASAFLEIFTEAVRCRLRSAFPVGSLLSGGLDSSAITCIARRLLLEQGKKPLQTFSAIFDQLPDCDERDYINPIVAQDGLNSFFIQGDRQSPFSEIEKMLWHQDEPFYAPVWFMVWSLYGAAQSQGTRVLLDGFDGDTTVSHGYGYLTELAQAGRWLTLAQEIRAVAKAIDIHPWQWFWSYFNRYGLRPKLSRLRKLIPFRIRQQGVSIPQPTENLAKTSAIPAAWNMIDSDFIQQIDLMKRYQTWQQAQPNLSQTERERHYRNVATQGLPLFALEVFNKSTAAFSMEARYPFWDKRLVEFCLSIPAEQKLCQGWDRVVMRRAMHGILPTTVQWRRGKIDFSPNLVKGLLKNQDYLQNIVLNYLGTIEGYVDRSMIQEIYQRLISEQSPSSIEDARSLWKVASLALWVKQTQQNDRHQSSQEVAQTS